MQIVAGPTRHVTPGRSPEANALPPGTGAVVIEVEWPKRSAQYIPSGTLRFDLTARKLGQGAPLATASLVFPNKAVTLSPIPAGTTSIEATAFDADFGGKILASGSVAIDVLANATVAASLELVAASALAITSIEPLNGVAADLMTVRVKGVVGGLVTAKIGGAAATVSNISVDADGTGTLGVQVPPTATSGPVFLFSDGQTAFSSALFTRIASVNVSPATLSLTPGATAAFFGVALTLDTLGGLTATVSNPVGLDFSTIDPATYSAPAPGSGPRVKGTVDAAGLFTAKATGDDLVVFGRIGLLSATAAVKIQ